MGEEIVRFCFSFAMNRKICFETQNLVFVLLLALTSLTVVSIWRPMSYSSQLVGQKGNTQSHWQSFCCKAKRMWWTKLAWCSQQCTTQQMPMYASQASKNVFYMFTDQVDQTARPFLWLGAQWKRANRTCKSQLRQTTAIPVLRPVAQS